MSSTFYTAVRLATILSALLVLINTNADPVPAVMMFWAGCAVMSFLEGNTPKPDVQLHFAPVPRPTDNPERGLVGLYGSEAAFLMYLKPLLLKPEIIWASAVLQDDVLYVVTQPGRHHHCLWMMRALGVPNDPDRQHEGFITSHGRYVARREAFDIAEATGHKSARWKTGGDYSKDLYSEDVWA